MNINKRLLYVSTVLAMMGGFSSCDSDADFLTEKPKSVLTVDSGYETSDQVKATLTSAYVQYEDFFFTGIVDSYLTYKQAGTDIMDATGMVGKFSNFTTWSTTSTWVQNIWDKYYKIISFCNLTLDKVETVTWSNDTDKKNTIAEAKFLRGLAYERLAAYFGGVPIVTEFSENPRFDYERETRANTYKYAIDQLTEALNALPDKPAEYGRVGKGAASMFLAEAYLALGVETNDKNCFAQAETYAKRATDLHPMMTHRFGARIPSATGTHFGVPNAQPDGNVISDLFVPSNILSAENTEAMWVIVGAPDYATYAAASNHGNRSCTFPLSPAVQDMMWDPKYYEAGAGDGPWRKVSNKYGGATNPTIHGGQGWGCFPTTWWAAVDLWDANHNMNTQQDLRFTEGVTVRTKFLVCDEDHSMYEQYAGWEHINKNDELACSKFCPVFGKVSPMDDYIYDPSAPKDFGGSYINTYRNHYAARSAEAWLLLAEAQLRQDKTGDALESLNTVRKRSNANPMTSIDLNTILDERARELLYEENRWATLLRFEPSIWKQRIYDYGTYSARSGKVYPEIRRWATYTEDIKFDYWPIPQAYIDLNTGAPMEQNKGW